MQTDDNAHNLLRTTQIRYQEMSMEDSARAARIGLARTAQEACRS